MRTITRHGLLVPVAAAVLAAGLFVGGVIAWGMVAPPFVCPPNRLCAVYDPSVRHQLHPLRAEVLWALSGIFALLAMASAFTPRLRFSSALV